MRRVTVLMVLAGLLWIGPLPTAARAQFEAWQMGMFAQNAPNESVVGAGSASIERPAVAMRLHVELFGKGKTLEEALENLKDRREAARVQLEALKADPQSIAFGTPTLSNPESEQRRRFEAMVAQRFSARGREVPKALKVPKSFTVSASLTAEWPLEADSVEQALLATQALQDKVKAADLAGTKDAEELSPEEEELAEEMADMMDYTGQEEVKPGEPYFLYVARISEEDRSKAFAEAFAKAKGQAAELARAAGARLGPLVALSGGGGGTSDYGDDMYGYERRSYLMRLAGRQEGPWEAAEQNEAVSGDPGSVAFTFHVNAVFRLEQ